MFNPEGVKGKTATPPHNFFKIMDTKSIAFTAKFDIVDVITGLVLEEYTTTVWNRSEYRAKLDAKRRVESYTLEKSRKSIRNRYGLTAEQLRAMQEDGVINRAANFYEVELRDFRHNPNPPKRVGCKWAVKAPDDHRKAV